MLFVSGETRCEVCHQELDTTDDVLVVSEFVKPQSIPEPKAGFYHFDCFNALSSKEAYLALEEADLKAALQAPDNPWAVLAANEEYALTECFADHTLKLLLLHKAREIRFRTAEVWSLFRAFVLGFGTRQTHDALKSTVASGSDILYEITKSPQGIELLVYEFVDKEIEFTKPAFQRLSWSGHYAPPYVGEYVDFEERCTLFGIAPTYVDGLLSSCKGRVLDLAESEDKVLVTLQATRRTKLPFSLIEFRRFQSFLQSAEA